MANPFTAPTISGYNASPPSDDGQNVGTNEITWAKHLDKLANPLKVLTETAITNVASAFDKRWANNVTALSTTSNINSTQEGRLIVATNTITLTLPSAPSVGTNWGIMVRNAGTGTVTLDGNGAETVNGSASVDLSPTDSALLVSDGTNFSAIVALGSHQTPGKLGQVVYSSLGTKTSGTTVLPVDDTIPQNTEGDEYLTVAITPTNSSSNLVVRATLNVSRTAVDQTVAMALFRDSTANALAAVAERTGGSSANTMHQMTLEHVVSAGSTSETTFKIRAGSPVAGTTYINGTNPNQIFNGVYASTISVTEVLP